MRGNPTQPSVNANVRFPPPRRHPPTHPGYHSPHHPHHPGTTVYGGHPGYQAWQQQLPPQEHAPSTKEPSPSEQPTERDSVQSSPHPPASAEKRQRVDNVLGTDEKAAASALLLAAGGANKSVSAESTPSSSAPLKKRKKHLDVLRRNRGNETLCQVSPVSSDSVASQPVSDASLITQSSTRTPPATAEGDWKDGEAQALTTSSKIVDAAEISVAAPPHQVEVPHHATVPEFPTILHEVLTHSEWAGSVIQWLTHGQAWRVVRWDALRRQVMPAHFPQLCQDDEEAKGSIDAFLWNVRAWGFEEIKDGPDAGAYFNGVSNQRASLHSVCTLILLILLCVFVVFCAQFGTALQKHEADRYWGWRTDSGECQSTQDSTTQHLASPIFGYI